MEFLKKQGVTFILNVALVLLTLVSMILYFVNKALPYFTEANVSFEIVLFLVLALVCVLLNVAIGFTPLKGNKIADLVCDVLAAAVPFLLFGAAIYFLGDRVYYYGIALGSDLEAGNVVAHQSCVGAIVGTAFMFVTGLLSIVTNFFKKPSER